LQAAMRDDVVAAAVGPVTAAPLVQAGILPIVPDRFRMGALIRLTCEHLEDRAVSQVDTEHGSIELRGKLARVGGATTALSPVSLSLFRTLVRANGGTVSRAQLAHSAPEALDDHGVDVAVSRLRAALPEARVVQTVIKRGYRIAVRS
jgi:uroporphyrinogen-III synthase